jgi:hypothetical protein
MVPHAHCERSPIYGCDVDVGGGGYAPVSRPVVD